MELIGLPEKNNVLVTCSKFLKKMQEIFVLRDSIPTDTSTHINVQFCTYKHIS